jgi:glycosyltransferase involved in cell wall biosynthesis
MGVPLKVFGKSFAGYGEELVHESRIMNYESWVEFLGEVTDEEKVALMRNARAFIFAAEDEDFGIVPVESMGQGTPVIAYKSGGVLETVIDGKTGILFDKLAVASLIRAIKKHEGMTQSARETMSEDCKKQAKQFSKGKFIEKIKKIVDSDGL